MFRVACAGHSMVWERQVSEILHRMSEQWLRETRVFGHDRGSFLFTLGGDIIQQSPP